MKHYSKARRSSRSIETIHLDNRHLRLINELAC